MVNSFAKDQLKAIRKNYRIAFFIFFCLCFAYISKAQKYYFDNYGVRDGLAQSKVYAVLQDNNGNLWLGTPAGVTVYDGINFKNYTFQDNLAKGGVKCILQVSNGDIWLGHLDGGISKYRNKTFQEINLSIGLNTDISSFVENNDQLWIATVGNGAILIQNLNTNNFDSTNISIYKGKSLSDRIFNIYKGTNQIYFITDVGIKIYNEESGAFENLKLTGMPSLFQIICMLEDSDNNLWFGTYHDGIYKYITCEKRVEYINDKQGLINNWITCLLEDSNKNIWAGTWGGGISKISKDLIKSYNLHNGLQDNNILSLIEDFEGNIIAGTWERGISIFKGEYFVSYTEEHGLLDNQVSAIQQDKNGDFWFGTSSGLSIYDPKNKQFKNILPENNSLKSKKIRFIKADTKGGIWIGTEDLGVIKYSKTENIFYPVKAINTWNRINRITAMDIDKYDNIWVGTFDGLIYYEIESGYSERYSQIHGLAGSSISSVFCDLKGIVWIGSEGKGVSTINISDSSIKIIDSLGMITPRSFTEDKFENIWIGTEQGVIVFDRNRIIDEYKEINGLLSNFITLINADENSIYIGTNFGLNKINLDEKKIYTFTHKNGFIGIEAKSNATFKDKDGNMWFGTANGIMKYNPKLVKKRTVDPLTYIKSFKVNLAERPLIAGTKLKHTERSIYFEFASVCITDPGAVKYKYMLEGIDEDWQPVTSQNYVNYPALPHGDYVFKVIAKNHLGIWNSEPVKFQFTIRPPFYKTGWFIISVIIIGIGIIISYIKIRERNLIIEKRVLEEKVQERTIEISQKNEELARKNKDITDSIKYAKRIQDAILPIECAFENTFILFMPKDIVSGDFFWMAEKDGKEIMAAIDCTGHGVPGAFVSFVGHNSLNKIVKEHDISQPDEILDKLNNEVTKTFNPQGEGVVNDGMDMSIICYDKKKNTLEYAGAFNPMFLFRDGKLLEYKANRFSIGRSQKQMEKKFTNNTIKLKKGDTIYLFSDGYSDQFGGPHHRKFMAKNFKNLLSEIQSMSIPEQKDYLEKTIKEWKGNSEQIDDILIIGRRFG